MVSRRASPLPSDPLGAPLLVVAVSVALRQPSPAASPAPLIPPVWPSQRALTAGTPPRPPPSSPGSELRRAVVITVKCPCQCFLFWASSSGDSSPPRGLSPPLPEPGSVSWTPGRFPRAACGRVGGLQLLLALGASVCHLETARSSGGCFSASPSIHYLVPPHNSLGIL